MSKIVHLDLKADQDYCMSWNSLVLKDTVRSFNAAYVKKNSLSIDILNMQ